jgi:Mce-associated membrane protein
MNERGRELTVSLPAARAVLGGAAAAALIAGAVVAGVRTHDLASDKAHLQHGLSPFEAGAIATAKSYAVTFATYRYDDLDADFAATEAHAVDPFLSQYRSTTDQLRDTLTKARASSTAKVITAGLASVSATQAVVDLFLDQTIVNAKGSHVDAQRVEMTLVRRDGKWLISKVVLP